MNRKESKGFIQLEWTCPNCTSNNPGPVKTCQNCGAPQPENVQFHRAAEEKFVTDEKQINAARSGADIHCGFCGTRNLATATTCSQCGADLKEGKAREAGRLMEAPAVMPKNITCSNCGEVNPSSKTICQKCGGPLPKLSAPTPPVARPQPQVGLSGIPSAKPQAQKIPWVWIGGLLGGLAVCCIVIAMIFFLPTSTVQGTVTNVYWQTSVPVQEVQAVNYSNESGNPPSDAYNVSCHDESREVCEDKTIDKGNGFAEVVQECHTETEKYCDYTVDEWKTIQTYTLDGTDLYPVYSDPSVSSGQRLGSSSEQLTVYFDTEKGQKSYSPGSVSEFQQFDIGSEWTLSINLVGSVVSVK
jgi:hypothetical protein